MTQREHGYWLWSLVGLCLLVLLAWFPEAIHHFVADIQAIKVNFIHCAVALCCLVLVVVVRTLVQHWD
jgi:hypothetical protein